ncbi:carbohydrate kinase family protein [Methanonatronarchaeum sp. AMET-Sl]|uniref:carbohydrate kinase family protein n=1 Tax=Methanonatronarchaeum sp. AMET-Sl TaxID=3037654 RepID=UPI00244DA810|nr:carbohydrate kinase family protein [Methanonatronarchaeum sp. AMET-Sl]WGI17340.1 carbohydrate kinase family protein [Methanonatronarchaeum sp. AMET-Sl]
MDVVGVGNLNLDRLLFTKQLAERGGESPITRIEESAGGSAYNTISWLSKSNLELGFIGAIGNDVESELVLKHLEKNGIDSTMVQRKKGRTGTAISIVDSEGDRTLYTYGGVGSNIELEKIDPKYLSKPQLIHISSFLDEKGLKLTKNILKTENRYSYNPGPLCRQYGLKKLKPIINKIDILFLSKNELKYLVEDEIDKAADKLLKTGVKNVVVTLGSQGAALYREDGNYKATANKVDVVDATGAGDAFAAGFIDGYLKNKNPETCLKQGNQMASQCLKKIGGSHIPEYQN